MSDKHNKTRYNKTRQSPQTKVRQDNSIGGKESQEQAKISEVQIVPLLGVPQNTKIAAITLYIQIIWWRTMQTINMEQKNSCINFRHCVSSLVVCHTPSWGILCKSFVNFYSWARKSSMVFRILPNAFKTRQLMFIPGRWTMSWKQLLEHGQRESFHLEAQCETKAISETQWGPWW